MRHFRIHVNGWNRDDGTTSYTICVRDADGKCDPELSRPEFYTKESLLEYIKAIFSPKSKKFQVYDSHGYMLTVVAYSVKEARRIIKTKYACIHPSFIIPVNF